MIYYCQTKFTNSSITFSLLTLITLTGNFLFSEDQVSWHSEGEMFPKITISTLNVRYAYLLESLLKAVLVSKHTHSLQVNRKETNVW